MTDKQIPALAITLMLAACGSTPFGLNPNGGNPRVDGGAEDGGGGGYHPDGFSAASLHGEALKRQSEDCRGCHGDDLRGGNVSVSCDSCHAQGWRTSCTFCHGGGDNQTGAPPRDLFDDRSGAFPAHTSHVSRGNHAAFDCTQCHTKPADVLSAGHVFDDTPEGLAEVVFRAGLSPQGTWSASQCSNLYCHGNGRAAGTVRANAGALDCESCHPRSGLGGRHRLHVINEGFSCYECHKGTVNTAGTAIANPDKHVNGTKDIEFLAPGFTRSDTGCSGTCHNERHSSERW